MYNMYNIKNMYNYIFVSIILFKFLGVTPFNLD